MAAAIAATPRMTPIAMPAFPPPERPPWESALLPDEVDVGLPDDVGDDCVADGFPPNGQ